MLKRKMTKELEKWKKMTRKPCLVIKGARQVGKTYIVREFAKANYDNFIEINFELEKSRRSIFDGDLDIKTLKMGLELNYPDVKLVPGKTLLFLDEIQTCPNARVALKTFAMDGTIDVIASGSLLGLHNKEVSSLPVGYVKTLEMLPLDFEEFLWGMGISEDTIETLRGAFVDKRKLSSGMIDKMEEYFRLYMIVGGMPEVNEIFLEHHSIQEAREKQIDLLADYEDDIAKYATTVDKPKIRKTFHSIPVQLAKTNKKFMFSEIDAEKSSGEGERKYASALLWLQDAGIVNFCYNLSEPTAPLVTRQLANIYKVYLRDTGLLMAMLEAGAQKEIWEKNYDVNAGSIVENVVAEEIYTRYKDVMYFEKRGKLEMDFMVNIDGEVTAVEIKSGKHTQSKSMSSIVDNYKTVKRYMKLEVGAQPMVDEKGVELYPLFMSMFI